jgi:hypothetical protein
MTMLTSPGAYGSFVIDQNDQIAEINSGLAINTAAFAAAFTPAALQNAVISFDWDQTLSAQGTGQNDGFSQVYTLSERLIFQNGKITEADIKKTG